MAVTEALRRRGVDVLRDQDDGTERMEDAALLDRASELQRALFTQDDDFLAEGAKRQASSTEFYGIIYAHQMRTTVGQCARDLELIAKVYEPSDIANRIEHLPLR
jgi:predicted nuclease of predicted toxin-antitoxin system